MKPDILIYGFIIFVLCLFLHIFVWRIKTPWVSSLVLLIIFLAIPAAGLCVLLIMDAGVRLNRIELVEAFVLHFSFSTAYIAGYPAVKAVSPSLDVLLRIASKHDRRITEEELKKGYDDAMLVGARFDDLKTYRFVHQQGEFVSLSLPGKAIILAFILYRRLLGLEVGIG